MNEQLKLAFSTGQKKTKSTPLSAAFGIDDDDEEEQVIPQNAKFSRNQGLDTIQSSGPNTYGVKKGIRMNFQRTTQMLFNEQLDSTKQALMAKQQGEATGGDTSTGPGGGSQATAAGGVQGRISVPLWLQSQQAHSTQGFQIPSEDVGVGEGEGGVSGPASSSLPKAKRQRTGVDQSGGKFRTTGVTRGGLMVCMLCERKFSSASLMHKHEVLSELHKRKLAQRSARRDDLDREQRERE